MTVIAFAKPATANQPSYGVFTEYFDSAGKLNQPGPLVSPTTRELARVTYDGRFALVKSWNRGYYTLAVRIGQASDFGLRAEDGWTADVPVYRSLNVAYNRERIADVERKAGELIPTLPADPFTVELSGEHAPRLRQLVTLRIAAQEHTNPGELGRIKHWGEEGRAFDSALRGLVADAGLTDHARAQLVRIVHALAEETVTGTVSYVFGGYSVVWTSPEPELAEQVSAAHDEAIAHVLATRTNYAEGVATLRAKRLELEAELVLALESETAAAWKRAQALVELRDLAAHSVDDAAQQLLDGGDRLSIGSRRGALRVAEELARIDAEVERAESDPVVCTVLDSDLVFSHSVSLADA